MVKQRLSSSIASLLNHESRWRWCLYILYVLCLDFNLSVILDKSVIFTHVKSYQRKSTTFLRDTLLDYNGNLFTYIGNTNLTLYTENSSAVIPYLLIVTSTLVVFLTVCQIYLRWPFEKLTDRAASILSFTMQLSEYIFYLLIGLLAKTILCVTLSKEASGENVQNQYLQIKEDRSIAQDVIEVNISVSGICQNIECMSIDHVFLCIFSAIGFICGCLLMAINNKISSHMPNPKISSKLSSFDLIHPACMTIILISKFVLFSMSTTLDPVKVFYLTVVTVLLFDLAAHLAIRPFYDSTLNWFRTLEILVLLTAAGIVIDHTWIQLLKSSGNNVIKIILGILLCWSMAMRLYSLTFERRVVPLEKNNRKDRGETSRTFYLMIFHLFEFVLESDKGNCTDKEKKKLAELLLEYYEWFGISQSTDYEIKNHVLSILRRYVENQGLFQKIVSYTEEEMILVPVGAVGASKLVRDIVKLLELMFDAEVKRYTHLQMQLPSHLINAYIHYLANFKGEIAKASWLAKKFFWSKRKERSTLKNLDAFILRGILSEKLSSTIESTELRMMMTERDDEDIKVQIDHRTAIMFFNKFEEVKKLISKIYSARQLILSKLHENVLFSGVLFEKAEANLRLKENCEALMSECAGMAGKNCTPLIIIWSFYTKFIEFNNRLANSRLRGAISRPFELSTPVKDEFDTHSDFMSSAVIVFMDAEAEHFHRINHVSSNAKDYLGFEVPDLVGKDLNVLIPRPFKEFHPQISQPMAGKSNLIRQAKDLKTYSVTKEDAIIPVTTTLRINPLFDKGLQVVGKLRFDKADLTRSVAIISTSTNKVLEVTPSISKLLQKNATFCNEDLMKLLYSLLRVENYIATHQISSMADIKLDHKDLVAYTKLTSSIPVCFRGIRGEDYQIVRFSKVHTEAVSVEILASDDRAFVKQAKSKQTAQKEGNMLGALLSYVGKMEGTEEEVAQEISPRNQSTFKALGKQESASFGLSKIRTVTQAATLGRFTSDLGFGANLVVYCSGMRFLQGDSIENSEESWATLTAKDKVEANHSQTKATSIMENQAQTDYVVKELSRKIYRSTGKQRIFSMACIILIFIFSVPLIVQLVVGLNKFDIKFAVYKEIKYRSKVIDMSSWSVWAEVIMNLRLTSPRMVYNGYIPDDYYSIYGCENITSLDTYYGMYLLASQLITYFYGIDGYMMNTTFPSEYPELARNTKIESYSYQLKSDSTVIWKGIQRSPFEAIAYLQPFIDDFVNNRDFNPWTGGDIGDNPDLDVVVEHLDKNSKDGILLYCLKTTEATKNYFLGITKKSLDAIYWSQYSNVLSIGVVGFLAVISLVIFVILTNKRLKKNTTFKITDVEDSIERHAKETDLMEKIFADSRLVYDNPRKLIDDRAFLEQLTKKKEPASGKKSFAKKLNRSIIHATVRVKTRLKGYRLFNSAVILLALLGVSALLELTTVFSVIEDAKIINNYMKVYGNTIDYWDYFFITAQAIDAAILWGRNRTVMNQPALVTARKFSDLLKSQVIENYNQLRNANLGNYTQNFTTPMFGQYDFCKDYVQKGIGSGNFLNCDQGVGTIVSGNVYNIIVKLQNLLDKTIETLETIGDHNKEARIDVLKDARYRAYRGYTIAVSDVHSEIYYIIMTPLSISIEYFLNKDGSLASDANLEKQFYGKLYGTVALLVLLLIYLFVVRTLVASFRTLASILQLFPVGLLFTNRILIQDIIRRLPRNL